MQKKNRHHSPKTTTIQQLRALIEHGGQKRHNQTSDYSDALKSIAKLNLTELTQLDSQGNTLLGTWSKTWNTLVASKQTFSMKMLDSFMHIAIALVTRNCELNSGYSQQQEFMMITDTLKCHPDPNPSVMKKSQDLAHAFVEIAKEHTASTSTPETDTMDGEWVVIPRKPQMP